MRKREIKRLFQENIIFSPPAMSIDKKSSLSFNQTRPRKNFRFPILLAYSLLIIVLVLPFSVFRINKTKDKGSSPIQQEGAEISFMNLDIWDYFKNLKVTVGADEEFLKNYVQVIADNLSFSVEYFNNYPVILALVDSNEVINDRKVTYQNKDYLINVNGSYMSLGLVEDSLKMFFIIDGKNKAFVINSEKEKVIIFQSAEFLASLIVKDNNYQYMEYSVNQSVLYINPFDEAGYLLLYEEYNDNYQITKDMIYSEEVYQKINYLLAIK